MNHATIQGILHEGFPHIDSDDPVSYFREEGDAIQALMYAHLYWPSLLEIHGAVFVALSGNDEAEISRRLATPVADGHPEWPPVAWREIVDSYNVFEVAHLFRMLRGSAELCDAAHRELGKFLVQTWRARLLASYPKRRFVVRMFEADESMDLRISVSQESPTLMPPAGWNEQRRGIISDPPPS